MHGSPARTHSAIVATYLSTRAQSIEDTRLGPNIHVKALRPNLPNVKTLSYRLPKMLHCYFAIGHFNSVGVGQA